MDVGTVLSVAQTLFAALQCSELRDIFSVLGYQSELDSFKNTVNTVKAVLLDAEAKADHEELSSQAQLFIEELKDAIYDADDLLDEFVTLAERRHQKLLKEGAVSEVSEKLADLIRHSLITDDGSLSSGNMACPVELTCASQDTMNNTMGEKQQSEYRSGFSSSINTAYSIAYPGRIIACNRY